MQYVVLAVVALAAAVIAVDTARQRAAMRRKPRLDALVGSALLRPRLGPAGGAILPREPIEIGSREPSELGGLWTALEVSLDPGNFRPKLAEGAEIARFILRWGDDHAMIASPDGTQHFQLELWEADLVQRMDGSRTTATLAIGRLEEEGTLDPGAVYSLVEMLRTGGILDPVPLDTEALVRDRLDPASPGRRRLREFGKDLKISWAGAEAFVRRLYGGGLHHVFHPAGLGLAVLLAVSGLAAFIAIAVQDRFDLHMRAAPTEAAILITLGFVLTFVHELGHALVMVHNDRRILGAGFFIFFGSPAFFVDASDILMLPKSKRIQQAFAGPFAEMALAGVASLVLYALPGSRFGPLLYRFALVNYIVIFENLIPLLRLDGYWILSDAIEVPDLRERSLTFLRSDLWHKLRGRNRFRVRDAGLAVYGIVGSLYTVFSFAVGILFWQLLFGDLISDLWRGGWGSRLLLVVLLLVFIGPVLRALVGLVRSLVRRLQALVRRARFRLERSWRIEAATLLDGSPAFGDLPGEVLSDLAGRASLVTYLSGSAIIRSGDEPDAFYVVREGSVAAIDEDPETGDERTLRVLGRGETFGEVALLERTRRAVSIRATQETQVFRFDGATFDRLLADHINAPSFAPTMQAYAALREIPAFTHLPVADLRQLLEHGSFVNLSPGEVLMHQGAPGDYFWAISSGQVDVTRDGQQVATLGAGEHVGEYALLDDTPRSATVTSRTPTRAFRLDREGFDAVVAGAFHRGAVARQQRRDMEH